MGEEIRGLRFPFRIDPATGGVATTAGDEKLREDLRQILLTDVGERIMRRDYGGGLRRLLHDPNDAALGALLQHQIARAIGRYEPRVLLQQVRLVHEGAVLTISLEYVVRRTRQVQRLSVPFPLGGIEVRT